MAWWGKARNSASVRTKTGKAARSKLNKSTEARKEVVLSEDMTLDQINAADQKLIQQLLQYSERIAQVQAERDWLHVKRDRLRLKGTVDEAAALGFDDSREIGDEILGGDGEGDGEEENEDEEEDEDEDEEVEEVEHVKDIEQIEQTECAETEDHPDIDADTAELYSFFAGFDQSSQVNEDSYRDALELPMSPLRRVNAQPTKPLQSSSSPVQLKPGPVLFSSPRTAKVKQAPNPAKSAPNRAKTAPTPTPTNPAPSPFLTAPSPSGPSPSKQAPPNPSKKKRRPSRDDGVMPDYSKPRPFNPFQKD